MPPVSILPETAPFNEEQRAWLDGFLAGWLGINNDGAQAAPIATQLLENSVEEEEDFPWHDPAIEMEERLEMAAERPIERKLMAAMAQLDCGSCGYDCQTYAEAIVNGEEKSLKLCSPGGTATAKKLKELVKLNGASPSSNGATKTSEATADATQGYSRKNPFAAKVLSIRNLNGDGSAKQTSHVEIDLTGSGITYNVGDSLGVYPTNCEELVEGVLSQLRATGDESIQINDQAYSIREALRTQFCLSEITEELIETLSQHCNDVGEAQLLEQYLEDDDPILGWDVYDLLEQFPSARLTADQLVSCLSQITPRLYSISSSLKAHPDQVHLTVGRVSWEFKNRTRKGVASTMFSDRMTQGSEVRVFVQKSHGFSVPERPDTKMIMIGPGTGIAPFRAFLEERKATDARGENWLFFGDQHEQTDFLYRDDLELMLGEKWLTRLDSAFSRDQEQKIYVQDRMLENGAELWSWVNQGAHIYVCGDAKRMASDVDKALKAIAQTHGQMSESEATHFLKELQAEKRYCRDVY